MLRASHSIEALPEIGELLLLPMTFYAVRLISHPEL